jgi:hypothetical protein
VKTAAICEPTHSIYRLVTELRTLVKHECAEALELRDRLAEHRRTHPRDASLDGRWSSTEDLLLSAEESLHEANAALAAVRGAPEADAERAYRHARCELERAFFEYRQAHRELSVLVAICLRTTAR